MNLVTSIRRSRRRGLAAVVFAAAFVVATVSGTAATAAPRASQIQLGAVLSMTGSGAYYGKYQKAALDMAVKQVNAAGGIHGQKVQLTVEDSRSSDTAAISALNKILGKHPTAIIGPVFGTEMLAMQPIIDRNNVPLMTISGTGAVTEQGSKNIFRTDDHDRVIKTVLINYIVKNLHLKKVGLIVTDDAWGSSGSDLMTAALKKYGLKPVGIETHAGSDTNMTAQLTKLKKAGAQIIVTQGYTPDTAIIINEAKSLNLGLPIFTSTDGQLACTLSITQAKACNGVYAAGLIMPDQPFAKNPKVHRWAVTFKKMEGFEPSLYSLVQYDGIQCLFAAMKKYGTDPQELRDGMHKIRYRGFNGLFHATASGNLMNEAQLYRFGPHHNAKWIRSVVVPRSQMQ